MLGSPQKKSTQCFTPDFRGFVNPFMPSFEVGFEFLPGTLTETRLKI
jgi:hypothetical protein